MIIPSLFQASVVLLVDLARGYPPVMGDMSRQHRYGAVALEGKRC